MTNYDDLFSKHQPDPLLRELNGNVIWYWKPMNPDDTRPGMSSMAPFDAADRIEALESALRGLIEAHENNWHPMKVNGAEWFTARAALREKKDVV
jgi:hypothetical protein